MSKIHTRTYLHTAAAAAFVCACGLGAAAMSAHQEGRTESSVVINDAPLEEQRSAADDAFTVHPDGSVSINGLQFANTQEYIASDYFRNNGLRCGAPTGAELEVDVPGGIAGGSSADCSISCTNPLAIYDPSVNLLRIPVVVHVIQSTGGQGFLSVAQVQSQIQILNEDFKAILGSNGQNGYDCQIEFALATTDPGGNPTNGITYHSNNTWYGDGGSYWNTIAWDPQNYLNIYTNNVGGGTVLGYVPFLPQQGGAGTLADRVVIWWQAFGDNSPAFPYHQGRTATHEVGHYLGLFHTFEGGCGSIATGSCPNFNCHTSGDRCCDTNAHSGQQFGCPANATCGDPGEDPRRNYMNYTDDLCMWEFRPEQAKRMRCTLEHYRPQLYQIVNAAPPNDVCASGTIVGAGSHAFTTINATTDGPAEPTCTFGGYNQVGNDVWFRYIAQCTGNATVNLCGAGYNSKLAVYPACPSASGTVIACADDTCGDDPSVTFPVVMNTSYRIRIGGFNGATGSGTLNITCNPVAPCPADVDNSGTVDVTDLLACINGWGNCPLPCPPNCGPDVNDDCAVNVTDLLGIINGWGACP